MNLSIGLAFLAGLASFLSPCVFSLVPVYISYLSGRALAAQAGSETVRKLDTFSHGLAFVLGFSVVFVTLGLTVSALGSLLFSMRGWLEKIGGLVVIFFGLHMTGILRIPFLDYDLRPRSRVDANRSLVSSFLMGVFFSAGWSPCVGPVLGAILTMALNGGSVYNGVFLLSAYSLGLGIPFLLSALGIGWVTRTLRNHARIMHISEIVMGGVLILVGVFLFLGSFEQLSRFGLYINFGL